jgi:hypothetical protein
MRKRQLPPHRLAAEIIYLLVDGRIAGPPTLIGEAQGRTLIKARQYPLWIRAST